VLLKLPLISLEFDRMLKLVLFDNLPPPFHHLNGERPMSRLSRRQLLKSTLLASAGAVAATKGLTVESATALDESEDNPGLQTTSPNSRERLLLDFGWRFSLGHANDATKDFGYGARRREGQFAKSGRFLPVTALNFDDKSWRAINLPHDWAVELPFVNAPQLHHQGAKPLGREYPETSVGWYRRSFVLATTDKGKRHTLVFDGVFRNAMVMFNGHYIGENLSGYLPFHFDVTDFVSFSEANVLVVRVDATENEGWFYEGAGIYRHVWLIKTDPLHVALWGNFVSSTENGKSATVLINTEVQNDGDAERTFRTKSTITDAEGKVAATAESKRITVDAHSRVEVESRTNIANARLWSLQNAHLYRCVTSIESNGVVTDSDETIFGIRTIRFDPDKGFFLNGESVKMKGTCNHQDHAGVGAALPDRLQYYRIERLKAMGSNSYRASHNPPTPELLDACDRLGMLVMDEARLMSSNPEGISQLTRLVRRDRNHPSVVIWCLGNEEREQGSERGAQIVTTMKSIVHKLDPTRPVTVAMNGAWGRGVSNVVDVQGFNYANAGGRGGDLTAKNIDDFHAKFPRQPSVGSETASSFFTRGIYFTDKEAGHISAYDVNFPGYANGTENWWKTYDARPFIAGGFAWTGFDYRGEPSPYAWPCISSHFGALDTCGFAKDIFYYYRSWWDAQPILHLFPHWNWAGKEGQEIDVWCYTNLSTVELFLNGTSLGRRQIDKDSHAEWKVKYTPGILEARAASGVERMTLLTATRETTGPPVRLNLLADRKVINADGEDVSVVAVEVFDEKGRAVPTADDLVSFKLDGPGILIGVGNGDPSCHEDDKPSSAREAKRSLFNGLAMVIVQSTKQAGELKLLVSAGKLDPAWIVLRAEKATPRSAL
jgi:beta-galactosidase